MAASVPGLDQSECPILGVKADVYGAPRLSHRHQIFLRKYFFGQKSENQLFSHRLMTTLAFAALLGCGEPSVDSNPDEIFLSCSISGGGADRTRIFRFDKLHSTASVFEVNTQTWLDQCQFQEPCLVEIGERLLRISAGKELMPSGEDMNSYTSITISRADGTYSEFSTLQVGSLMPKVTEYNGVCIETSDPLTGKRAF